MTDPLVYPGEAFGVRYGVGPFKWGSAPFGLFWQDTQNGVSYQYVEVATQLVEEGGSVVCQYAAKTVTSLPVEEGEGTPPILTGPVHGDRDSDEWWYTDGAGAQIQYSQDNYARFRNLQNLCCFVQKIPETQTLLGGGKNSRGGNALSRYWAFLATVQDTLGNPLEETRTLYLHHRLYQINHEKKYSSLDGMVFVVSDSQSPILDEDWDEIPEWIPSEEPEEGEEPVPQPEEQPFPFKIVVPYSVLSTPPWFPKDEDVSFMLGSLSSKGDRALVLVYDKSFGMSYGGRPTTELAEILELTTTVKVSAETGLPEEADISFEVIGTERAVAGAFSLYESATVQTSTMTTDPSILLGVTDYLNDSFVIAGYEDVNCHINPNGGQIADSSYFTAVGQGRRSYSPSLRTETYVLGAFYGSDDFIHKITVSTVETEQKVQGGVTGLSMTGKLEWGYTFENGTVTEKRGVGTSLAIEAVLEGSTFTREVNTTLSYGSFVSFTIQSQESVSGLAGLETVVYETRAGAAGEKPEIWEVVTRTTESASYSIETQLNFEFPELPSFSGTEDRNRTRESESAINMFNLTFYGANVLDPEGAFGATHTHSISRHGSISSTWGGSYGWTWDLFSYAYAEADGTYPRWLEFYLDMHAGCDVVSLAAFIGDYGLFVDQEILRSQLITREGLLGTPSRYTAGGAQFSPETGWEGSIPTFAGFYDKNRDCASYNPITKSAIHYANSPVNWSGDWSDPKCWPAYGVEPLTPPSVEMLPEHSQVVVIVPDEPEE